MNPQAPSLTKIDPVSQPTVPVPQQQYQRQQGPGQNPYCPIMKNQQERHQHQM